MDTSVAVDTQAAVGKLVAAVDTQAEVGSQVAAVDSQAEEGSQVAAHAVVVAPYNLEEAVVEMEQVQAVIPVVVL